jgi:hypothetical protein
MMKLSISSAANASIKSKEKQKSYSRGESILASRFLGRLKMPNELLTMEQISKMILHDIQFDTDGKSRSIKEQRAIMYDMQTSLGGFPSSEEERAFYIKTGKVLK